MPANFDIEVGDNGGGHLMTKARLDYEDKDTYTVVVTADDGSGEANATASITVTIEVKDLDEKPEVYEGGLAISGESSVSQMENSPVSDAVGTYTATGSGAASATWTVTGDDADDLTVDRSGESVMLRFRSSPNYEAPADADGDNVYKVTLEATDGTYSASRDVTVAVTNVDELGTLSGEASVTYAEDRGDAAGTYALSGGTMDDTATWTLDGADRGQFRLDGTGMSRMLMFSSAPDYEAPADADGNNAYEVTVKAEAGGETATLDVTITVTNAEEGGTVTLDSDSPVVGNAVMANLTDPDGGVTGITWQWARAGADGSYNDIAGETSASYTPVTGDVGMTLRATASYTDDQGPGKSAEAATDNAVVVAEAGRPPGGSPDL